MALSKREVKFLLAGISIRAHTILCYHISVVNLPMLRTWTSFTRFLPLLGHRTCPLVHRGWFLTQSCV